MRIIYDHQVFSIQKAGGASRYHCELIRHRSRLPNLVYIRRIVMTVDESAKTATLDQSPQILFSGFGDLIRALAPGTREYTFSTVPGRPESTMDAILRRFCALTLDSFATVAFACQASTLE